MSTVQNMRKSAAYKALPRSFKYRGIPKSRLLKADLKSVLSSYEYKSTTVPKYVINCNAKSSRFIRFKKDTKAIGLKTTRIPCTNGRNFDTPFLCWMTKRNALDVDAAMTKVEISISLSHMDAWRRIANGRHDYGIVMEDDSRVFPRFTQNLNQVLQILRQENHEFDVLFLWNGNWGYTKQGLKHVTHVNSDIEILRETREYIAGGNCYVLRKDFALKLIQNGLPILHPVDNYMGMFVNSGRPHLTVNMSKGKNKCLQSAFMTAPCDGPGGTGAETTQDYNAPEIKDCLHCKTTSPHITSKNKRAANLIECLQNM